MDGVLINFLKDLILEAGRICLSEQIRLTPSDIAFKNSKDLVTGIDKKVENFLIQAIQNRYSDHGIFGEETGRIERQSPYVWIIDPIDGTTSFIHQQPYYSISIALYNNQKPVLGAVYTPAFKELFFAEADKGAFLNDRPIRVSKTDRLIHSVMATGFACLRSGVEPNNLAHFNRIVPEIRDIRRYGSAALDLCYVACGRCDGFWEMNLNLYDIAAGSLIVTEAGGKVTDFNGGSIYPEQGILAANPNLAPLLQSCLSTDRFNGETP